MAAAYERFYEQHPPHERPGIARHREEVAAIVADCGAIAIAGGHVGVLNDCLHLCNLAMLIEERPLLAWSAGCMAVTERIVVVDDDDPAGRPDELYDIGIGVARGMVALPSAGSRLHAHDADRLCGARAAVRTEPLRHPRLRRSPGTARRHARRSGIGRCGRQRWPGDSRRPSRLTVTAGSARNQSALARLRSEGNTPEAIDRLLRDHRIPLVEGSTCTFLWRGEADWVGIEHRTMGVPIPLPLRRLKGTDLWHASVELPPAARIQYRILVRRHGHQESMNDPLEPAGRGRRDRVTVGARDRGLRHAGVDVSGSVCGGGGVGRPALAEQGTASRRAREPVHPFADAPRPPDATAGGARRRRLSQLLVDGDGARQPHAPAPHGGLRRRVHVPRRPAARVRGKRGAQPFSDHRAGTADRGAAAASRRSAQPGAYGSELRWGGIARGGGAGARLLRRVAPRITVASIQRRTRDAHLRPRVRAGGPLRQQGARPSRNASSIGSS